MFTEIAAELLDLSATEKGQGRARYAVQITICSSSCCTCLFLC